MDFQNMFSLQDKTAIVTGASRGLGQAIAIGLAKAGALVICSSSRPGGCSTTINLIKEARGNAIDIPANLMKREDVENLFRESLKIAPQIDILVNNGGTIERFPALEFPLEAWDKVLEINLTAPFYLSQLVAGNMKANGGGKIINIASLLSYSGGITVPAYTASKHGIAGVTKALANEWAKHNIQVNAIAPGYFRTDNTQKLQDDPVRSKEIQGRIPADRWGDPQDLQGAVIFLASAASDYVNGTILNVDGGWMAR